MGGSYSLTGAQALPSVPLWPVFLLGLLVTLHPLLSLEGGGVQEGLEGYRCECVCVRVRIHRACTTRACVGIQARARCVSAGCELGNGHVESTSLACMRVHGPIHVQKDHGSYSERPL